MLWKHDVIYKTGSNYHIATPSKRTEAIARGNIHKNLVKISCAVFKLCERTDKQTWDKQTNSLQYFAPLPGTNWLSCPSHVHIYAKLQEFNQSIIWQIFFMLNNVVICAIFNSCVNSRVAVDMDIHGYIYGYIHGYIHVWISDLAIPWIYPWTKFLFILIQMTDITILE